MHWKTRLSKKLDRWKNSIPLTHVICSPRPLFTKRKMRKIMTLSGPIGPSNNRTLYVTKVLDKSRTRAVINYETIIYKRFRRKYT